MTHLMMVEILMIQNHYDDPVLVIGRVLAISVLLVAPWGIVRTTSTLFRRCLWVMWFLAIAFLTALYLGFLTYHYIGPQLGFSIDGNSMNAWMIALELLSVIPFILAARKGRIEKPLDLAVIVAFGALLLVGPPILNSVALNIYTQGGGEFDSGQGDYSGEVSTPVDQASWGFANGIGLFVCNLIPLLIFITIWLSSKRSNLNSVTIDSGHSNESS